MNLKTNLISIALANAIRTSRGHSWVEKVESVHGQGSPRVDLSLKDDVSILRDRSSCSLMRQLPSNPSLTSHITATNRSYCSATSARCRLSRSANPIRSMASSCRRKT